MLYVADDSNINWNWTEPTRTDELELYHEQKKWKAHADRRHTGTHFLLLLRIGLESTTTTIIIVKSQTNQPNEGMRNAQVVLWEILLVCVTIMLVVVYLMVIHIHTEKIHFLELSLYVWA